MATFLTDAQLDRLARQVEVRVYRQLVQALRNIRNGVPLSAIERALLSANRDAVLEVIGAEELANALHGVTAATDRVREEAFGSAGETINRQVDPTRIVLTLRAYAGGHPHVLQAVQDATLRRIQHVTQQSIEAIRGVLARSLSTGTPPRETAMLIKASIGLTPRQALAVERYRARLLAEERDPAQIDRMVGRYGDRQLSHRARTIATTETFTALSQGKELQWKGAIDDGRIRGDDWEREFVTADDELVCPRCASLHGVRADIGQPFVSALEVAMAPPVHPNCVLGDSLVTASPRIAAVSERIYRGPVHRITTASGKRLACTPNHPVLTERGFLPAASLNVGDHVVRHRFPERRPFGWDDDEQIPACIEDIAEAARCSLRMRAAEVPVAAPDFHGDGMGSEVAVIWADLLLGNRDQAAIEQPALQDSLGVRSVRLSGLSGRGGLDQFLVRPHATAGCVMCGGNLGSTALGGHPAPLQALGLALPASGHVEVVEPLVNHEPSNPEGLRERVDGLAGHVPSSNLLVGQSVYRTPGSGTGASGDAASLQLLPDGVPSDADLARDLLEGQSGEVHLDRVISIERSWFSGHVYNLETADGWYAVDGIITHNCRCVARLTLRGFRKGQEPSPRRREILAALGRR